MKNIITTVIGVLVLVGAVSAQAPNATGTWDVNLTTPNGPMTVALTLKKDGEKLSGTIVKAAVALKQNGAERVLACAVHGVLSGPAIERLEGSPLDQVIITNTIPLTSERARQSKKIKQLSVARLLGQAIRSIHEETSVSSLFV